MDLAPATDQVLKTLVYVVPLLILILLLKTPWFKGIFGKFIVNFVATLLLNKDEYRVIKNIRCAFKYIRYIKSKKTKVLTPEQVRQIIDQIEAGRLTTSFKTHREHAKHIRETVQEKQNSVVCPRCGSTMVLRQSKKGEKPGERFWGCSRYPQCKGIKKIS